MIHRLNAGCVGRRLILFAVWFAAGATGRSQAPAITTQPATQAVTPGGSGTLSVVASGGGPLAYQWFRNGVAVAGATNASYAISNAQLANAGRYSVTVTNAGGAATSAPAQVNLVGQLWAVGADADGQLGIGTIVQRATPFALASGVRAVAAGPDHSLFLKTDGTMWAMGYNDDGRLGDGTTNQRGSPVQVEAGVNALSAGKWHSLYLKTDGTLWAMGSGFGVTPVQVASGVASMVAGGEHSLFVKTDGTLWAIGNNARGQLGDGTTTARTSPVQVAVAVSAVAAGEFHSLFLKTDGTLWAMGANGLGNLGDGTTVQRNAPVQVAVGVSKVAAGGNHSLFCKIDGSLWATGAGASGQLGDGTATSRSSPVQVATGVSSMTAGQYASLFLKTDGSLWGMGYNLYGELGDGTTTLRVLPVQLATGMAAAAIGWRHSLQVRADGTLWVTGSNTGGILGTNTTIVRTSPVRVATEVASTAAGQNHGLYLKVDGTLWAMGLNVNGPLGDGTTTRRAAPVQVDNTVSAVAAGQNHSLYLRTDGTLWAMGLNAPGQLGDGTTNQRNTPVQVAAGVSAIAAGEYHSLFLKADGTLWAMGLNSTGQLGDGTTTDRPIPVQVAGSVSAIAVGGGFHSFYIKRDGTLWAMGSNSNGQLGDGTTTQRNSPIHVASGVSAVAAGWLHSLFLKNDGTVWAMGANFAGQLGDGTKTQRNSPVQVASGVSAVAAGWQHSLYLKSDGTLWAMGSNDRGQLGDGTTIDRAAPVPLAGNVFAMSGGDGSTYFIQAASVGTAPTVTTQPAGGNYAKGVSATLTAAATGSGPLDYRWRKDGVDLPGARSAVFSIPCFQAGDAGSYAVVVSNSAGSVTSNAATLAVATGASGPTASNVNASQSTGTKTVAIAYTLSHPQSLACTVTLQVSRDNGASWESVASTTGALGTGVTSTPGGLSKSITWNVGNDWPAQLFPQAKIRIAADDGQGGGVVPTGFVTIPAGTFTMGDSIDGDTFAPTHAVVLAAFYMATTEETWSEWVAVRDWAVARGYPDLASVGAGQADTHPVQNVSWYEVIKWLNAKSEKEGIVPAYYTNDAQTTVYRTGNVNVTKAQVKWSGNGYRLPTEAEWEYAARGGLAGKRFPWGDTITHQQANYWSTTLYPYDVSATRGFHPTYVTGSQPYTSPVGSLAANGYGLVDMAGNVWEWCWDWSGSYGSAAVTAPSGPTSGSYRVFRGGGWNYYADSARSAVRGNGAPDFRGNGVGFRPARSLTILGSVSSSDSPAFSLDLRDVGVPPAITTQPPGQTATAGQTVAFTVIASGTAPLSYQWRRDGAAISGATSATLSLANVQSANAGGYTVVVTNSAGSVTSTAAALTVTITAPGTAPTITTQPTDQTVVQGATATFSVGVNGTAPFTYQWRFNGAAITGATSNTLVVPNGASGNVGAYTVLVTNSLGSATSQAANLRVGAIPTITAQPADGSVALGNTANFSVTAAGSSPLSYQWSHDGRAIAGANNATLSLPSVTDNDAGSYTVTVTNAFGAVTSRSATLVAGPASSRIINLSVLTRVTTGSILTVGFVVGGQGPSKPLLVRGIGPSLSGFGVSGPLADPELEVFKSGISAASNDNWSDATNAGQVAVAAGNNGAFALPNGSKDSALVIPLPSGEYTAQLRAHAGSAGSIGLLELYDAEREPTLRLANVSVLTNVGTGSDVLTVGFAVKGNTKKDVLVRAIGPTLATFQVNGFLNDPQFILRKLETGEPVATNSDWWRDGGATTLPAVFARTGAFALVGQTLDAALLVSVDPGSYTVTVSGAGNTTGIALVEIYEVP